MPACRFIGLAAIFDMSSILSLILGVGIFLAFGWMGILVVWTIVMYMAVMIGLNYVWEEIFGFR